MSEQYKAALLRGLVVAIPTSLLTFLSTWTTTDHPKTLVIAAATAFLAPFTARFGGEGHYDSRRAAEGNVKVGDVSHPEHLLPATREVPGVPA